MRGLERYEGAPVERMRAATRLALENLVDLCIAESVSLLLLAGDIYDGDWKDYATGLFFAHQMSRLRKASIRVALIHGNHDAASAITRYLELPDNVSCLPDGHAATVTYDDLGIAVHGQSYATAAEHDDLSAGYPEPLANMLNIGLLHTAATGRPGHARYAPCTPDNLAAKGYDYWALGHVHAREVLSRDPWIVFAGNLQGRHARETGPKGATLITVCDGAIATVEPRTLDAVRWVRCEVDVTDVASGYEAVNRVREALEAEVAAVDGRLLAARVVLTGRTVAHGALIDDEDGWAAKIRAEANDVGDVWVEKIQLRTEAELDVRALAERDDAVGQIAKTLQALQYDDASVEALMPALSDVRSKLPSELRSDGLRLDDPEVLRGLLGDVEHMLLTRLLAHGRAEQ